MVVKKTPDGERGMSIDALMLNEGRTISLTGPFTDELAELIVLQLLYLDSKSHEPIHLYINSPGGSVTAGMAIYDTMKTIGSPVHTYCLGLAASMGAFILSSGDKRYCMPEAEVMIHQPSGGSEGQAQNIKIAADHILRTRDRLNRILAMNTGKDIDTIAADTDRDNWFTADGALAYGLVDEIIPYTKGKKTLTLPTNNTPAAVQDDENEERSTSEPSEEE